MATIGYIYPLPTTSNVSFSDFVRPHQGTTLVSDATACRGRLRSLLKEHKQNKEHVQDYLKIQNALEEYIPLLLGLGISIDRGTVVLSTELVFSHSLVNTYHSQLTKTLYIEIETTWACTMTHTRLSTKDPQVKQKSVHYETVFTFLTLAYVIMNRAQEQGQRVQSRILAAARNKSGGSIGGGLDTFSTTAVSPSPTKSGGLFSRSKDGSGSSKSGKKGHEGGTDWIDLLDDATLQQLDTTLTTAADLYCQAAGIFQYLTDVLLPKWDQYTSLKLAAKEDGSAGGLSKAFSKIGLDHNNPATSSAASIASSRPVDVQHGMLSAHMKLAMAEAHACTVRKASIKASRTMSLVSKGLLVGTGSAAPKKTSFSLLGKLSNGVKEEYEKAYGLLKSLSKGDFGEIVPEFRLHVKEGKLYYEAMAQVNLAFDANDSKRAGLAVGFMSTARTTLLSLTGSSSKSNPLHHSSSISSSTSSSSNPLSSSSASSPSASNQFIIARASEFELWSVQEHVSTFQKINDSVTFEIVPSKTEIMGLMPSGRDVLSIKAYIVARPNFGTGISSATSGGSSTGFQTSSGGGANLSAVGAPSLSSSASSANSNSINPESEGSGHEDAAGDTVEGGRGKEYALQGAYF